jgi:predicted transcriptional regulator
MTTTTETKDERRKLVAAWVELDLAAQLDEAARQADRSRSATLREAIRRYVAHDEREGSDGRRD